MFVNFFQIFAEPRKVVHVSETSEMERYVLVHNIDDFCGNKVPFVTDNHGLV